MNPVAPGALPIGVFDSGLGGLTVIKTLRERFPHEHFLYLGDTARIPYGTKSPRTITNYLQQNIHFLQNQNVKAIVVACNSASTVIDQVQSHLPLYNVIEPGAAEAVKASKNGQIGVIATRTTVANKSYVTQIKLKNQNAQIFQQACPLLVPLVEEGWDDDPITNLIVYRYLSPLLNTGIDTLVLGCTHYPILKNAIRKVTGPEVNLVESGPAIARLIEFDFQNDRLKPNHSGQAGEVHLFSTDVADHFQAMAERIMSPLPIKSLELVDLKV